MVVKVYGYLKAGCAQRVLHCFLEKEIEFELIKVDLDKHEHKKPEHLLRQPFGQVPAIEDGDMKLYGKNKFSKLGVYKLQTCYLYLKYFVTFICFKNRELRLSGIVRSLCGLDTGLSKKKESRAILRYYATKYADQGTDLLGKTLEQRAIVDQWMETEASYFSAVGLPIIINLVFIPRSGEPCDVALVEELKVKMEKILDVYENRLATNRYLAGDEFTLADLTHMPGLRYFMNEAGLSSMVTSRPNLNRWWNDISARPAWKKLMEMAAY